MNIRVLYNHNNKSILLKIKSNMYLFFSVSFVIFTEINYIFLQFLVKY